MIGAKAGLKSSINLLKNIILLKTNQDYAPFCAPSINFVKRWNDPDPEYAPVIIRNNRLHVGCMFWQPADFSANSDGVI
ncbi:hypothetical protein ACUN6D_27010, partial [Serratia sp. IR-2025]